MNRRWMVVAWAWSVMAVLLITVADVAPALWRAFDAKLVAATASAQRPLFTEFPPPGTPVSAAPLTRSRVVARDGVPHALMGGFGHVKILRNDGSFTGAFPPSEPRTVVPSGSRSAIRITIVFPNISFSVPNRRSRTSWG